MFIQTESLSNPATMKFIPGREVLAEGTAEFGSPTNAGRSPLARRIFAIPGVTRVFLGADFIVATKAGDADWMVIRPQILAAIMEHFLSRDPVLLPGGEDFPPDDEVDAEVMEELKETVELRIRPAVQDEGGDIALVGFGEGIVKLRIDAPPEARAAIIAMRTGIERMLRHYLPEVEGVRFVEQPAASDRPGLATPEAERILKLLEDEVNPTVAAHGGYISLIDVRDNTAFIRMEGGCQGCGMAKVTLRQGVELQIKEAVPSIVAVFDVTQHADGKNPYFQPTS